MEQMSTYSIKIRQSAVHRKTLSATAGIYRKAVGFFIAVCLKEWDRVSTAKGQNGREHAVESLTVRTAKRKTVLYDFGRDFYKFPSYLRRAAIAEAAGKVSSYMSNLSAWESPFPAEDGYAEVDLDEVIDAVRKNPAAAAAEYNGRKVIFKGKTFVSADGDIDVRGLLQDSKGSIHIYSARCRMNGDQRLLAVVRSMDNSAAPVVYVKGTINSVSDCSLNVDTKELVCFDPDKKGEKS